MIPEEQFLLMVFSEWLDSQGLIVGDKNSKDKRSHEELARDFLATNPKWL